MVVTWRHRANGRCKIDSRKHMATINTGKSYPPNKSLFSGQVLLETIALSTGRLNNEGFIESLYASLGPIQLTREVTAKPFCWISMDQR